jgi:8-oxo-dGTP diphosphatase
MKLLATIKDADIFSVKITELQDPRNRQAARAIVFDEEGKIAILKVAQHGYHKLPGGGIKTGEGVEEALRREVLEEIGCRIDIGAEIGKIVEHRGKFNLIQESLCYIAKVKGEKGVPNFTQKERDNGFEIVWVTLNEAVDVLRKDCPNNYEGKFIQKRDLMFLEEARK